MYLVNDQHQELLNKASLSKFSTCDYYKKNRISQEPLMEPEIHWEHTEAKQIVKIKGICRKNVNSNLQIA